MCTVNVMRGTTTVRRGGGRLLFSVSLVVAGSFVHFGGAGASAVEETIVGPADATSNAVRLRQSGPIRFPMAPSPRCEVLDSFGDPRSAGRSHEGVDILATLGQPILAVEDGVLIAQYSVDGPSSSLSGNAWKLRADDAEAYFYAHMAGFAAGLQIGSRVQAGDIIGFVGDTGNPGTGNFHLHFEYQPNGTDAVDSLQLLTIPFPCRVY